MAGEDNTKSAAESTTIINDFYYPMTIPDHDIPFPISDLVYRNRSDDVINGKRQWHHNQSAMKLILHPPLFILTPRHNYSHISDEVISVFSPTFCNRKTPWRGHSRLDLDESNRLDIHESNRLDVDNPNRLDLDEPNRIDLDEFTRLDFYIKRVELLVLSQENTVL